MMKGKKLIVLLMAVCMMISMSFGMVAEAATTAASTQEQAELMAGKAYTIKKGRSGKWFYQNSKGKTDKKQGWKKDKSGKYAYYVGSKGYVTAKVTSGVYQKWSNNQWKKQTLKKNSTKTICGKAFYVNKNGNIEKKTGWKKVSGKYAYYVNGNGAVSVKITKGVYQKWSNNQWKKQKLTNYVGGIITIQKKAFFVGSDNKIIRKCGWNKFALGYSAGSSSRGYTGTEGSVLYYESTTGAYKINAKGEVPKQPMKNGWNGSVFVKNGKVQIKTTVTVGGYINVFNKDGKRVTLKKSGNKIVRSDTNEPVTTKGAYKVGSGSNKQTYYVTNNGNIKKNGTVTVNGVKYTVDASGKCTKVTENGSGNSDGSGNDGEQNSGTNGNQDQQSHVCKWKLVMNSSLSPVKTNYKEHAAVTKTVNKKIRDAYDEPVYGERVICRMCKKQFLTYEDWGVHSDETNHGNCSLEDVIVDTIHHDAVYADVKEVVEKEWSEWDQTYKCTVCGDIMTEHVVNKNGELIYTPNKSGVLVDINGNEQDKVTAGVSYK